MTGAKEYAEALFLLAKEDGTLSEVCEDLYAATAAISDNPDYLKLLSTPALSKEERVGLIDESAEGLSLSVKNLLKLLAEGRRISLLGKIYEEYSAMLDEERGIVRAEAVTAVAMSDAQIKRLVAKLGAITGKTVVLKNTVDPTTLGGVKLRYAGNQLDGSIRAGLERFENALAGVVL